MKPIHFLICGLIFLVLSVVARAEAIDFQSEKKTITKSGTIIKGSVFLTFVKVNQENCKVVLYDGLEAAYSTKDISSWVNPFVIKNTLTVGIIGPCTVDIGYFGATENAFNSKKMEVLSTIIDIL